MAIGTAVVIVSIALTLITKADFDVQSNDAASDYAEVRVLLNEYYKLIARKYSSSNDYNAKEVNVALQNTSFDDGTEASTNRKGGVAGELFENDILLTLPQARRLLKEASGRNLRQAQVGERYIWPQLNVSYAFGTLDPIWQNLIREALNYVQNETCIRFQENNNSPDYLQFIRGSGCWSNIGRVGGRQQISIGYGCEAVGIIAHETLHALGLWHEQSRSDRDQYISINYDNVFPGTHGNFEKRSPSTIDNMGQPYDLGSVMHYGSTAFAIDYSRSTITTLDPKFQQTIGQRAAMSFKDTKMINLRYCSGVCSRPLFCQNEGYTDPNKCFGCKCPGGYGGILCETVEESVPSTCGGEISATDSYTTLTNPPVQQGMRCVWKITSSAHVEVIIDHLKLPCEETCLSYVELKFGAEKTSTGSRLCCSTPSTPIISENGDFIVIFNNVEEDDRRDVIFQLRYRNYYELPSTATATTSISATTPTSITSIEMTTPANGMLPTYGSWSKWSEWSTCSVSCGGCGVRQRVRKCGPNAVACQGSATVDERCGERPCPPIVGGFMCRGRLRLPCDLIDKLQFGSRLDNATDLNNLKLPHMNLGGKNHQLIREYEKNRYARSAATSVKQFCEKHFVFSCPTAIITIDLDWKRANNNLINTRGCCKGYYVNKGICEMIKK